MAKTSQVTRAFNDTKLKLREPGTRRNQAVGVDGPRRHRCAMMRVVRTGRKESSTMSITMIGLDTAKSVFQVHAIDETGKAVIKRKLRRSELIPFFERLDA